MQAETGIGEGRSVPVTNMPWKGTRRLSVTIDFAVPGGKSKSIEVADGATPEAAALFSAYFKDVAERLKPSGGGDDLTADL